jgi:hypothetical protein
LKTREQAKQVRQYMSRVFEAGVHLAKDVPNKKYGWDVEFWQKQPVRIDCEGWPKCETRPTVALALNMFPLVEF